MTAKTSLAVTSGTATNCHATATQFPPVNIGYCHALPTRCHYCLPSGQYRGAESGSNSSDYEVVWNGTGSEVERVTGRGASIAGTESTEDRPAGSSPSLHHQAVWWCK